MEETKRLNEVSNQYLRNMVCANQQDWVDYVVRLQFSYNISIHSTTKQLFYVVAYEVDLLQLA